MKEPIIATRNAVEGFVYRNLVKRIFFSFDPEFVHDRVSHSGALAGTLAIGRGFTRLMFDYQHPMLHQEVAGITFRNPVGLGAGFDKDAHLVKILPSVGFGFVEFGSISARPFEGNPKPRLHRLIDIKSLVVNMGLKSDGIEVVAPRLEKARMNIPFGTNLAPTNVIENREYDKAIADYVTTYTRLAHTGAYTTLNLSCPNTRNDMPFLEPEPLHELLHAIRQVPSEKPLFLKISPDLTMDEIDKLMAVAEKHKVDGFIATNLTKNREKNELLKDVTIPIKGGVSGTAVQSLSDAIVAHIARQGKGKFAIIGLGGIFTPEDAYRKIGLGANVVQLVSGMIFGGPQTISTINQGLVRLLKRDGFSSISEAVGKDL